MNLGNQENRDEFWENIDDWDEIPKIEKGQSHGQDDSGQGQNRNLSNGSIPQIDLLAQHGGQFIEIPQGRKGPRMKDWPNVGRSGNYAKEAFREGQNIGLNHKQSLGLVCLDFDGSFQAFKQAFPELAETLTVYRENAPQRAKLYFRPSGNLPESDKENEDNIEFFNGSGQTVIAGIHPSGAEIKARNTDNILAIDRQQLNEVWEWYTGSRLEDSSGNARATDPIDRGPEAFDLGNHPYPLAALEDEARQLRQMAPNSGRNDFLNQAAFKMGRYVAGGCLDRKKVEKVLTNAALDSGLNPRETVATLESGLTSGLENPKGVPVEDVKTYKRLDKDLLKFGPTDVGNAESIREAFGERFAYVEAYGWLTFNGRFWQREGARAKLTQATIDTLKARRKQAVDAEYEAIVKAAEPSGYNIRTAKKLFRDLPGITQLVGKFDNYPNHLNVANGVLNLKTGELSGHSPDWKFTYCLDIPYDPEADQSQWVEFLEDVVANPKEVLPYIQEAVGYSLTGHIREECLFYLQGPTRAGKGTFTETLMALLGKPLSVEADFNTFTSSRRDSNNFDLAPLKPSRFVVASESNQNDYLNSAFIKKVTGGNDIYCSHKNKPHFSYRPQFKIWLVSNEKAKADPDDEAAWYRLKVIHFPKSFAGREDKTLKQRLRQPEVLKGVLAWAVEGAKRWYGKPEGLEVPDVVAEDTEAHRREIDEVAQFLEDETREKPGEFLPTAILYKAYTNYCERNGYTPKKKRSLGRSLGKKGFDSGRPRRPGKKRKRGWYGLELV